MDRELAVSCESAGTLTTLQNMKGIKNEDRGIYATVVAASAGKRTAKIEDAFDRYGGTGHRRFSRRCALQALDAGQCLGLENISAHTGGPCEDSLMSPEEGLTKAAHFLNDLIIREKPVGAW